MAKHVFTLPDVGEGIHESEIVEWVAKVGDFLKEDEPLCRVETDKAVVDLPSPVTGKLLEQHGAAGEVMQVGNPLATFEVEGAGNASETAAPVAAAPVAAAPVAAAPVAAAPVATAPVAAAPVVAAPATNLKPQDVRATPHTRALARKLGVGITTVVGTGRNGRITDGDVELAAQGGAPVQTAPTTVAPAQAAPLPQPTLTTEGPVERVPLTFLRRKIAEHMNLSVQRLVHVTHVEEADVTDLFKVYKRSKAILAKEDIKLSPLPYFVKAVVACLKKYPTFNCVYDQEKQELIYKKYYNIGIAVDTPKGLVVPVIKDADRKDIATIAAEIRDLALRARDRTLRLDEMKGGTYTITNIGPLGGVLATPIINYPEVAILALHAIEDKPAVVDGEICIRKKMYISTSFDHQIIDGGDAARFMRELAQMLSNPDYLFTRI